MCLKTPVEETRGGKPDLLSRWVLRKIEEASGHNKKLAALEKVLMNLEMTDEDIFDCFYVVASRSYTKNVDQAIKIFIKVQQVFRRELTHSDLQGCTGVHVIYIASRGHQSCRSRGRHDGGAGS